MSISLVNVGAFSENTSNSITPALPASMQAGDLMFVLIGAGGDAVTSTVSTPPGDGWAARGNELWYDYGNGGAFQVVYWKIHDGSESDPTFGMTCETGNGGGLWAATCAFRSTVGFPADPFDLAAVSQHDNWAQYYTPPSVTVQTTGATVISFLTTSDNNVISFSSAEGFTLSDLNYASTQGSDGSLTMAYKHNVSAGSVTMPTYSLSLGPDYINHQTIAIKENAAPQPPFLTRPFRRARLRYAPLSGIPRRR